MDSIEDVLSTLEHWLEAKRQLTVAYKSCDSSPDYFCRREAEAEHKARERFGEALKGFVDARIGSKDDA